jgi:hypothetical protein
LDFRGAAVTIESLFYTQLGSIIAFLVSLFVLYRLLVSSKDATIETLRQQISLLESRIQGLSENSPDVLLQRMEKRATLLTEELKVAEKEKTPLLAEIEELKKRISSPESQTHQQELMNQLVAVSQHVALLNAERQQLANRLREAEEPYLQFLHYANAELSPGRRQIVSEIVSHFGVDWVAAARAEEIMKAFTQLAAATRAEGMHPQVPINGGALTGLRSVGLINDRDELTLVGVSMFKAIAKELKSNKPLQPIARAPAERWR